jgi:FkbM family methyltransferase
MYKMTFNFKSIVKRLFLMCGLDVSIYRDGSKILRSLEIDCVLDVGANFGQYSEALRKKGYAGTIISFEPLTVAHEILLQRAEYDKNWIVNERVAIGSYNGKTEINISNNFQSSSLLPMLALHLDSANDSKYVSKESVDVRRLDSYFDTYNLSHKRLYIKIDTQGFEREVLFGLGEYLSKVHAVELEMSTALLYEGAPDCFELFDLMQVHGFKVWDLKPAFRSPVEGRLLQFDCLFVRT